jgi:hypothetical protein
MGNDFGGNIPDFTQPRQQQTTNNNNNITTITPPAPVKPLQQAQVIPQQSVGQMQSNR